MTIPRPLGDKIIAKPIEQIDKIGSIVMPENYKQALTPHFRAKVVSSGPKAQEYAPVGAIIHVSNNWGELFEWNGETLRIGRIRDINGVMS